MRCLIVDDSAIFLRAAGSVLEREGVAVTAASTGGEAHRMIDEVDPDVVLVDVDLGDENGFDVVAQLSARAGSGDRAPHLILISSHGRQDLEELLADSPALGFLSKSSLSAAAIRTMVDDGGPGPASAPRGR